MLDASAARRVSMSGLYALTPEIADTAALTERVAAALAGGASAVQYRNKTASARVKLEQALALRELCADCGATLIVNDDLELAAAAGADGVHLGRDDASVAVARERLGPSALIGASCYDSLACAEAAIHAGADHIAFGSFFVSKVKPHARRAQLSLLTAARARWSVGIVAIGGITPGNAGPLLAAGADALAVISALFDTPDVDGIAAAARDFAALFASQRLGHPA
jgi:thiamine-phosphate pyrophosphorylase